MKTTEKLYEVIADALSVSVDDVSDTLAYQSIPEWDSMSHLHLVAQLETSYDISIDTEDVLEMENVTQIKDVLKKHGIEIV